jgi:hypothetical protein
MGTTSKVLSAGIKTNKAKWSPTMHSMSYLNIAGRLTSEMVGSLRSSEPCESSAPFRLVLIGNRGDVVFECEVGEDWKVQRWGTVSRVRRSHFPATAFLTDRSLVTRTFLIEREPSRDSIACS